MSYAKVKLGGYIDILSGFTFKSKDFTDTGIPVIKIKNVQPPYVTLEDLSYVPNDIAEKSQKFLLQYNDVLIALTGSHINQMASVVGRVARVKYSLPSLLNQRVGKITSKNNALCDIDFVYYYLSQNKVKIQLAREAGGAANQANISPSDVKDLEIPFPCIEIQRRIADILSAYDNLIENNQKQIKLLEEAARRLYKEWFVDLRFPGHETTPVVDGVPEGWEQQSLGRIASVLRRGISPKYDDNGKYFVISQKCIRRSIMDISEVRRESRDYSLELNLQDKDTVICSTGTGTLGRVGQVFGVYQNTTFDSHVTLVRTKEYQNFIYQSIKYQQEFLMGMGRGSTNQQELYRGVIEGLLILVPTQEILNKADNILSAIHDKITALNSQIGLLVEARDRLLPKLMSGEIEV
jgi:type I restriction enzyme S subunit